MVLYGLAGAPGSVKTSTKKSGVFFLIGDPKNDIPRKKQHPLGGDVKKSQEKLKKQKGNLQIPGHPKVPCFLEVFSYIKPLRAPALGVLLLEKLKVLENAPKTSAPSIRYRKAKVPGEAIPLHRPRKSPDKSRRPSVC